MKKLFLLLFFPFALFVALILVWEGRKLPMKLPNGGGINYAGYPYV